MEVKLFEVRDRLTFIAVVAVLMRPSSSVTNEPAERYLLRRCGYALNEDSPRLVAVGRVEADGRPFHYDPFAWADRTMLQAHAHIARYWDALSSGAVIDVEYILGETIRPKRSERVCPDRVTEALWPRQPRPSTEDE